jgi:hypothetical protein
MEKTLVNIIKGRNEAYVFNNQDASSDLSIGPEFAYVIKARDNQAAKIATVENCIVPVTSFPVAWTI